MVSSVALLVAARVALGLISQIAMKDPQCVQFLQWALPRLQMRWPGFRKVRKQVCKRIDRRLRELGVPDIEAYRRYLEAHEQEWSVLDSFCRIPISRFYRDRSVFDCLRDEVLPTLATMVQKSADQTLWCWHAGCASGEEVYTLSIIWKLCLSARFPDVSLHVVATDINPQMLERARHGCYAPSSLKDFPRDWLPSAFTSDELYCVKPEFRENIELRLEDIRRDAPPEQFHLIFCRHSAFTYFDHSLQVRVLDRLIGKLWPDGFLIAGKQEPLPALPAQLAEYGHRLGIYRKDIV